MDQTRAFIWEAGLEPHPGCKKRNNPSEHCPLCQPLFPLSSPGGFGFELRRPPTDLRTQGWLSTAIEKGVPEVITLDAERPTPAMRNARRYIELGSPKPFYDAWAAFEL